jgi:hypothetical protein
MACSLLEQLSSLLVVQVEDLKEQLASAEQLQLQLKEQLKEVQRREAEANRWVGVDSQAAARLAPKHFHRAADDLGNDLISCSG